MCSTGGANVVLRKYVARWRIPTDHFVRSGRPRQRARPLAEWLVDGSTIRSSKLKRRLYAAELKTPRCELCGQDEMWNGSRISLILDHVNGKRDDNRLENLRIVCPNCNASLETHCGRNATVTRAPRECIRCGSSYVPKRTGQRYCSPECGSRWDRSKVDFSHLRKAERPPVEELVAAVAAVGYREVGRRHGVSDVSIRKWIADYGVKPPPGGGRRPPDRRSLTDDEAARALRLLSVGIPCAAVAESFGVTHSCMSDLRLGRTYRHLERPEGLARPEAA
jgi:hypothetical protein